MKRRIAGILLGLVVGFLWVAAIEAISSQIYPFPEGSNPMDPEAMKAFVASLPTGAFLLLLLAHFAGAFSAGMTCAVIVREKWRTGPAIIGGLMLIAGIVNLVLIPHPVWVAVADVVLYFPAAFAGAFLAERRFANVPPGAPVDGK